MLLMVSTNVMAEWTEVSSDGADMTGYVDYGTIKKKGNKVKMWRLFDFKTVQKFEGDIYLSFSRSFIVFKNSIPIDTDSSRDTFLFTKLA